MRNEKVNTVNNEKLRMRNKKVNTLFHFKFLIFLISLSHF